MVCRDIFHKVGLPILVSSTSTSTKTYRDTCQGYTVEIEEIEETKLKLKLKSHL